MNKKNADTFINLKKPLFLRLFLDFMELQISLFPDKNQKDLNLSWTFLFNLVQLEFELICTIRELYNPKNIFITQSDISNGKQKFLVFFRRSLYLSYIFIYYFFPIWFFAFLIRCLTNFKLWKLFFVKFTFSIAGYRNVTKKSITSILPKWNGIVNLQFALSIFPFLFAFSQMIVARYQDQSFSYFLKKTLPGLSLSLEKLSWETFEYITSQSLNKNTFLSDSYPAFLTGKSLNDKNSFQPVPLNKNQNSTFGLKNSCSSSKNKIIAPSTIKRADFYNDFLLIELNENWQKQKYQNYISTYSKKKVLNPTGNKIFNIKTKNQKDDFSIGNKWFMILSKNLKNSYPWLEKSNYGANLVVQNKKIFNLLNTNYSSYFYSNLDELPIKILNGFNLWDTLNFSSNSFKNSFKKNKLLVKSYLIQEKSNSIFTNLDIKIKSKKIRNDKPEKTLFLQKQKEKGLRVIPSFIQKTPLFYSAKNCISSDSLEFKKKITEETNFAQKKWLIWSQKNFILSNELKNLFFYRDFQPSLDLKFFTDEKFFKTKSEIMLSTDGIPNNFFELAEDWPEEFLKEFNTFFVQSKKANYFIQPRTLSGYYFPDMTTPEIRSFIWHSFYHHFFYMIRFTLRSLFLVHFNIERTFQKTKNTFSSLVIPISPPQKKFVSSWIKVSLPSSFLSFSDSTLPTFKKPKFEFKYQPTFFEGLKKAVYEGPGLLRDETTKDVELKNKKEVQKWLTTYFSPDIPITDRSDGFFGKNYYLEVPHVDKNSIQLPKDRVFELDSLENKIYSSSYSFSAEQGAESSFASFGQQKEQLFYAKEEIIPSFIFETLLSEKKSSPSTPTDENNQNESDFLVYEDLPVIPCRDELQVPYIDENEWHIILEKIKAEIIKRKKADSNFKEKEIQIAVPLIRIRIPQNKLPRWPLNQVDYQASFLNSALNLHFLPFSQFPIHQNGIEKKLFGGVFQKIFSIYPVSCGATGLSSKANFLSSSLATKIFVNEFSVSFHQFWEPFTKNSWLILTKFGYSLFVYHVIKSFYKQYGKELIVYVLDLFAALGIMDEGLKEELGLVDTDKGFRIIQNVQKRFQDVAGIDSILPELGEIVWFLRHSGRFFQIGNIIPKGILLTGPPGTGKTLLVQAIAGEAEVPVLVQSGSSLNDPEKKTSGIETLQTLFEEARALAPCIVFIDEIDTLGQGRENIIQNPMGEDEIIESIYEHGDIFSNQPSFVPKPQMNKVLQLKSPLFSGNKTSEENLYAEQEKNSPESSENYYSSAEQGVASEGTHQGQQYSQNVSIQNDRNDREKTKHEQLALLMQFLVELDGLQSRKGVVVIGATNRPNVLDLALTRPGRFDRILNLEFPSAQKRIEILKLYSKNIGVEKEISWDYLANRTLGFSAAHLAAAMNESAMQAVLKESVHNVQTIEKGIETITSYPTEKFNFKASKDPFFKSRLAFYQAGKAVLHTLLSEHPPAVVLHLWPRPKNPRQRAINITIQKRFLELSRRSELETKLIGLYAGKAAELLILSDISISNDGKFLSGSKKIKNLDQKHASLVQKFWQSDFGIEDLHFASSLAYSMVNEWYFYSKKLAARKRSQIFMTRNSQEFQESEFFDFFHQLVHETEVVSYGINTETQFSESSKYFQKWSTRPWWQNQILKQTGMLDPCYEDWYRIYLPEPDESERNEEWVPPDEYYHNAESLLNIASNSKRCLINWNDLYEIDRDYIYHGLILTCFNQAILALDKNRELLDYFAFYLVQYEIIRQYDIKQIFSKFSTYLVSEGKKTNFLNTIVKNENLNKKKEFSSKSTTLYKNEKIPFLKVKQEKESIKKLEEKKQIKKIIPFCSATPLIRKVPKKIPGKSWSTHSKKIFTSIISFPVLLETDSKHKKNKDID